MSALSAPGASGRYDAIVVGGGLAGMLTALELRPLRVALLAIAPLGEATSSAWAQGGIAAAVGPNDAPALHAADTIAAGAGLVDRAVATRLATDAPRAIEALVDLGARFERKDGALSLGREAAHSRRRIVRAGGDATGAELVRAAREAVLAADWIERYESVRACDVVFAPGSANSGPQVRRVDGIIARSETTGDTFVLRAAATILATGGVGGLYRFTTNPPESRGAGIALAARAGARLADLEFVQFHPTALDVASDPLPLITEGLRGEGATLIDESGAPIMEGIDPAGDLASRDVVARRVFAVGAAGGRVFLDARELRGENTSRFPTVFASCMRFGIDPRAMPIPVVAAAHYHMGGVWIDLDGRTSVSGLFACGEVAASGVHGANRLASNSLLEAAVYPERIARAVRAERAVSTANVPSPFGGGVPDERGEIIALPRALAAYARACDAPGDAWHALRETMYANAGVERDAERLVRAIDDLDEIERRAARANEFVLRDAAFVGAAIARAALARHETRGSHVRLDAPKSLDDALARRAYFTLDDLRASVAHAS